jgi:hypothetical protein
MYFHCPRIADTGIYSFITPEEQDNQLIKNRLSTYAEALDQYASADFIRVRHYMATSIWGQHPCLRKFVANNMIIPAITFECSYMQANGKS